MRTVGRRFGSWALALKAAGLKPGNVVNYPDSALFQNIMQLWEYFGRQPRLSETYDPPSTISGGPYKRRFGSWSASLKEFVKYANGNDASMPNPSVAHNNSRGPRDPNLRLRFKVLKRDNFRCTACGASPVTQPGLILHVDHILPWSMGGKTIEDNLQTLCEKCNLGKSNVT